MVFMIVRKGGLRMKSCAEAWGPSYVVLEERPALAVFDSKVVMAVEFVVFSQEGL
jgi:hypothetical protein